MKPQISGLALASLALGGLSLLTYGLAAILGLFVGLVALWQIRACNGRLSGHNLAISGIIVSGVMSLLLLGVLVLLPRARAKDRKNTCLSNQRQISTSIFMYAQDNDDKFPRADTWSADLVSSYGITGRVWDCPSSDNYGSENNSDYGYNVLLNGIALEKLLNPQSLLLTADIEHGTLLKMKTDIATSRHTGGFCAGYADGHVIWLKADAPVRLKP